MGITPTEIVIIIAILALSISVHETVHAIVASWLGDRTAHDGGRISLNPLHHIDPITTVAVPLLLIIAQLPPFAAAKPVPINPYALKFREFGMAIVAVAGPISNLLLAVFFALLVPTVTEGSLLSLIVFYGISINIGLGLFNLIPFPPLDGSRVLYAIAPDGLRRVMMEIEKLGFAAIAIFVFVFFPMISGFFDSAYRWVFNLFV